MAAHTTRHMPLQPRPRWTPRRRSSSVRAPLTPESCLVYLYYRQQYAAAYEWAGALLRRLHVLRDVDTLEWLTAGTFGPYARQTKHEKALSHSAVARESLDLALRCLLHLHAAPWAWSSLDRSVVYAAFERVRADPAEYRALLVDGQVNEGAAKRLLVRR